MFDSIDDLGTKLAATGYFIDPVMTKVVFLAGKLQKPLLLEGPAGSGKTLMSIGIAHAHANGKPYSTLVMCPPHLVLKWAREVLITVPLARTFVLYDLRNGGDPSKPHGVVEVKMRNGHAVAKGLKTTLSDLRKLGRKGWRELCP